MDAELKQYLVGMEERIVSSIRGYVNERSELVKDYVNERSELVKEYVNERCELVETKLLTEFHRWASPAEARSRTIAAALRAIDLEMESIADRAKKLEGRPPQ